MPYRFSKPMTTLIIGLVALFETTLQVYPGIIPVDPLRFFVSGALPLLLAFLYQEEGITPPSGSGATTPAPTTTTNYLPTRISRYFFVRRTVGLR